MKIATSPTREKYPLSKKKIFKETISSAYLWILLILIIIPAFVLNAYLPYTFRFLDPFLTPLVIFFIISVIANFLYEYWYFAVYHYDLTEDLIIIKKGPITTHEITVPYERIQDVYVDQDILDRILGLYDVHLSTATNVSAMEAHIDGVEKEASEGLRTLLLETVQAKNAKKK